ncbi:MAG TPA: 5-(carboxyamino)imidazole ribonucleotide synthase [Stellaceae bacterium]|nr:5-(carboxyamino)imidazole ribonucleotide synthase [Stellaceae bacterium]
MLAPGSTIGILGGGQLGRMTALAAARLGYRSHIYTTENDSPGVQVTSTYTVASLDDEKALAAFAKKVDVVTYETENIPLKTVEIIDKTVPARPGAHVLEITQDRLREKDYLRSIDVDTAPYREITGPEALARALHDMRQQDASQRAILKTVRMGYDGKGQVTVRSDSDPTATWAHMNGSLGILEGFVDFRCEISVIVARGLNGGIATYAPVENQHANHILDTTIAPARIPPETAMRAEAIARHIAEKLDVIGLLAVEMFVTQDEQILVNELAPRPHNSGHWTMDACYTSQFEQLVRAICGLPLGSAEAHSDAVMRNLIGPDVARWADWVTEPMTKLHLYGKHEAPVGRKMGHATRLIPKRD